MASSTRITVTLPVDQIAIIKRSTGNVSAYVADAIDRKIRHQLLGEELRRYESEHGAFTDAELESARIALLGE